MGIYGKNNIKKEVAPNTVFSDVGFGLVGTSDWDQGDLLVFDDSTNKVRALAAETEGNTFLGVAVQAIRSGVVVGPYTGITENSGAIGKGALAGPVFGVEAEMIVKTGDTLNPGDLVYALDAKTIQVAGTKAIGIYVGNVVITTAAAGTKALIRIGSRFPQDTLRI